MEVISLITKQHSHWIVPTLLNGRLHLGQNQGIAWVASANFNRVPERRAHGQASWTWRLLPLMIGNHCFEHEEGQSPLLETTAALWTDTTGRACAGLHQRFVAVALPQPPWRA